MRFFVFWLWMLGQLGAHAAHAAADGLFGLYGFIDIDVEGVAHVYLSARAAPAAAVWVQWPDTQGRPQCCKKLRGSQLRRGAEKPPFDITADDGSAFVHYRIANMPPLPPRPLPVFIGMALSAWPKQSVVDAGPQRIHTSGPGPKMRDHLALCYGSEGIRLHAHIGTRQTRAYLHLGYAIEEVPRCVD